MTNANTQSPAGERPLPTRMLGGLEVSALGYEVEGGTLL